MPKILTGQSATSRTIADTTPATKSSSIDTSFLFFSNNPEEVKMADTADQGRFLYRDSVTGAGQVYT